VGAPNTIATLTGRWQFFILCTILKQQRCKADPGGTDRCTEKLISTQ